MKIEDFRFTKQELIIIDLAAKGYENKEIAQNLGIKVHQVRYSVNNVKVKISFHSKFATTERMFTIFCHEYMKKLKEEQHEERIEHLTSIQENTKTTPIIFSANIGQKYINIPNEDILITLTKEDKYPTKFIKLSRQGSEILDHEELFYPFEVKSLLRKYNEQIKPSIQDGSMKHISIFAIAPMPLLIYLGSLFASEQAQIEVYQRQKDLGRWGWVENDSSKNKYDLIEPNNNKKMPVLVISLSSEVNLKRIYSVLGPDISIWQIKTNLPNSNLIRRKEDLQIIKEYFRKILDKIKNSSNSNWTSLSVFPIMPVSACVELGRVYMPKTHLSMDIYDQSKEHNGFYKALTIE